MRGPRWYVRGPHLGPFRTILLSGSFTGRSQRKAPAFHGTAPGWECEHRHRTQTAAIECGRRHIRQEAAGHTLP
jgi:hypothetical protein